MDLNKLKNMNRKHWLIAALMIISVAAQAQTYYKWVVTFKDKAIGQNPYTVAEPQQFLTQRSLDRRAKLNIPVTEQDLPIYQPYINDLSTVAGGFTVINRSRWFNYVQVGSVDSTVGDKFLSLSYVASVKKVFQGLMPRKAPSTGRNNADKTEKPVENGPVKSGTTGTLEDLQYGNASTQVLMLGVDYLHRKGFMGQGMLIAVIDAGFQNANNVGAFDYMRQHGQLMGTWDFVVNDSNVYDDNSHGTGVLSCMAGYIDGQFIGTAPKASYWLLRSEDANTETISEEYNWVVAAEFADSVGADLINSSLGYTTFDDISTSHEYADLDGNTTIITRAADIAAGKGILVVNSAGNSGNSTWHYIGAPADADSILSVGAVTDKRVKAGFSSFGPSFDGRIKPDVSAMGQGVYVVGPGGVPSTGNGTSYAGPILCGAVASLWSKYQTLDNLTVIDAVRKSAHLYSVPDNSLGYGIPNFGVAELLLKNTDFDDYFDKQQINVYPNPVSPQATSFYLDFYSAVSETIRIEISSVRGKQIFTMEKQVYEKSLNTIPITIDHKMAAGTYVCNVYTANKRFTCKFIKG